MSDYRVHRSARIDLAEIFAYIGDDNIIAAQRVLRDLISTFRLIAFELGIGRLVGPDFPKIQKFRGRESSASWWVYYRQVGGRVVVLKVLHGNRDEAPALCDLPEE